jgi:hypothetical protein
MSASRSKSPGQTGRLIGWLVALLMATGCSSKSPPAVPAGGGDGGSDGPISSSADGGTPDAPGDGSTPDVAADGADGDGPRLTVRRPSCTAVRTPITNPGFEMSPVGGVIPGWQTETTGTATVGWDRLSGYGGSAALVFRVPDDASTSQAVGRQTLELDPNTAYFFGARVAAENARPRGDDRFLFTVTFRTAGRTWTTGPAKLGRTEVDLLSYPFGPSEVATGSDGRVEIELRTAGPGRFIVDDLFLECNPEPQRFASRTMNVNVHDRLGAGPSLLEPLLATADRAVESFAALTGALDPTLSKLSSTSVSTAWISPQSGDPIIWGTDSAIPAWASPGFLLPTLALPLARAFDRPAWQFDDSFARLYLVQAVETLDLRLGANDATDRGANYRKRFEAEYRASWVTNRCATIDGLIHKNLLIRDQVGWEPFKKTFRDLAAATDVPASRWDRLRRWHQRLGETAGMDVWATFTDQEKALLESRYNPPAGPLTAPAALSPNTTETGLGTSLWESAYAGGPAPPRNRLPDGCPLVTGTTPHPLGLSARAFSQYVFRLGGAWTRLVTGYALAAGTPGAVIFRVRGDGKELLRSPAITPTTPAQTAEVDITGVDRLELVVDHALDGMADLGVWIDPRLTR